MHSLSDTQLVASYLRDASETTLQELIGRHVDALYAFVSRYVADQYVAEDIVQEAFFRAWKNLGSFDPSRNFKTWLFNIAKNAAIDFLRKKKDVPLTDLADEEGNNPLSDSIADPDPWPDELLGHLQESQRLAEALGRLAPKYRIILTMHYQDDLALSAVADLLSLPLNTVKSQHRRGLMALRGILEEHVDAP